MAMTTTGSQPLAGAGASRIDSVELCRVLAVFAVIMIHTKPFMQDLFPSPDYRWLEYLFNQPPRFAVPFFFVTAGYFLGRKAQLDPQRTIRVGRYLQRLSLLLVGWSLLYVAIPSFWPPLLKDGYWQVTSQKVAALMASPLTVLLEGAKVHLWFLPALMMGVVLLALTTRRGRVWPACLLALLLFGYGLLAGPYSVTPLGLKAPFTTRDGPFLSMIGLTIGYLLARRRTPFPLLPALALAVGGLLLHFVESWWLWRHYAVSMIQHNYLLGTVVAASGLLMTALAVPQVGRCGGLSTLGRYTLGVYASHYLFVDLLGPYTYLFELHIWQLLMPLLVYLLAVGLSALLSRCPGVKVLVS